MSAATPRVVVRPGRIEDAETIHAALVGIARVTGAYGKVRSTPDDIRRHGFGVQPRFSTLIAEVDDIFAGLCLSFDSFSTWRGVPGVYVQDLFVIDRFRRLGIGLKLLARVSAEGRARGAVYLRLSVDAANVKAQEFYERIGLHQARSEQIHAAYDEDFARLADLGDRDA